MDRLHNSDVQRHDAANPTDVYTETAAVPKSEVFTSSTLQ